MGVAAQLEHSIGLAAKTRLIEFGRYAAENRARRGDRKPETFEFLGLTHIRARTRKGRFKLNWVTSKKKTRAKLSSVKTEMRRRWCCPLAQPGAVLRQACIVVRLLGFSDGTF